MKTGIFWIATLVAAPEAWGQGISLDLGDQGYTANLFQFVALLTVLSLAPSLLMMVTSFTRLVVVFSFLRSALGLQQSPPNPVLISLSLFLTLYIMSPTLEKAYDDGLKPYFNQEIKEDEAFQKTTAPFEKFMKKHTRDKDLKLFQDLKNDESPQKVISLPTLIPAFMISELKKAFEIGFLLFIPFLIIDMVVASILMSMGMMMVPPVMIALPFKVIFFVIVDGWHLIVESLVKGYL